MSNPTHWERLGLRLQVLHIHWQTATGDLSDQQVNHHEREGVLPIAFSLVHALSVEDRMTSTYLLDSGTEWETGNWASKVGGSIPQLRKGDPVSVAETTRIGNMSAWIDYQSAVFSRTEHAFEGTDRYDEVLYPDLPEKFVKTSLATVCGPDGPVCLGDLVEVFVYAHGSRHLGEIEHARSLVGLEGVS